MLRHCILAALMFVFVSPSANAVISSPDHGDIRDLYDNRPVPWPWRLAMDFPWNDIQGMWKVERDGYVSYFAMKVVNVKATGERQLQVRQFDGFTCKMIATGVGFESKQSVKAQMSDEDGHAYRVSLTAFKAEDAAEAPKKGRVRTSSVMVLSIASVGTSVEDTLHWQITKVATTINPKNCTEDVQR